MLGINRKFPRSFLSIHLFLYLTIFFMLSIQIPITVSANSANSRGPAANPNVTIEFDYDTQTAIVEPGCDGVVTFTGQVSCSPSGLGSSVQNYYVVLSVTDEKRWGLSIVPTKINFSSTGGSVPLTLLVKVESLYLFS